MAGPERMTAAQYRASRKSKRNKFGNKRVVTPDGQIFDSAKEARRWGELKAAVERGEILSLDRQVTFVLAPSVRLEGDRKAKPALRYKADFVYFDCAKRQQIVEDIKSAPTAKEQAFRIRQHLLKSVHGIDLRIVK